MDAITCSLKHTQETKPLLVSWGREITSVAKLQVKVLHKFPCDTPSSCTTIRSLGIKGWWMPATDHDKLFHWGFCLISLIVINSYFLVCISRGLRLRQQHIGVETLIKKIGGKSWQINGGHLWDNDRHVNAFAVEKKNWLCKTLNGPVFKIVTKISTVLRAKLNPEH